MNRFIYWLTGKFQKKHKNYKKHKDDPENFTNSIMHCPECGTSSPGKIKFTENGYHERGTVPMKNSQTVNLFTKSCYCKGCSKKFYKTLKYGWIILDVNGDQIYQVTGELALKEARKPVYSSNFERAAMRSFRRTKRNPNLFSSFGAGSKKNL